MSMEDRQDIPQWLRRRKLPDGVSLEVLEGGVVVFTSTGKWLYPLLAVETYLAESGKDASLLVLHDRIAGRAAAALAARMGFRLVKACMISRLAEEMYRLHGVRFCADEVVDRIACVTEDLIDGTMDLDEIHTMICSRAAGAKKLEETNLSD